MPGPRGEIARILRNLIDNAVAHSPEGGTVAVTLAREDGRVRVAVSDQGPGISKADAPHIFTPFFRGSMDQGGDEVGAGLGLTIARAIVRRHGGNLLLDHEHVDGARFVLELPMSGTSS